MDQRRRRHCRRWILENTPTMKKSQWPRTVPLAWSEYVSVRYGHSPTGGVQLGLREKE